MSADNYTDAIAWPAEGARVGLVTCTQCGAAVFLSPVIDAMALHDDWHDAEEAMWRDQARMHGGTA